MGLFIAFTVSLVFLASTAFAACPTTEDVLGLCKAGSDLAPDLAADMPVVIDGLRLEFPLATNDGLMIVASSASARASNPANVAAYLCDYGSVREFVASGGTIEVVITNYPFFELSFCEAP